MTDLLMLSLFYAIVENPLNDVDEAGVDFALRFTGLFSSAQLGVSVDSFRDNCLYIFFGALVLPLEVEQAACTECKRQGLVIFSEVVVDLAGRQRSQVACLSRDIFAVV